MHNAPPVSYPLGRCALPGALLWSQTGLSLSLLGFWAWAQSPAGLWWFGLLLVCTTTLVGWRALRGMSGQLCWDGAQWRWLGAARDDGAAVECLGGCVGEVDVVFDAQQALLLRWRPLSASDLFPSHTAWLWLGRAACPDCWLALRRAVHGSHRS